VNKNTKTFYQLSFVNPLNSHYKSNHVIQSNLHHCIRKLPLVFKADLACQALLSLLCIKRTDYTHQQTPSSSQQCHNCDGGLQEYMTTAKACRKMFPGATIVGLRKRAYPIEVTVTAKVGHKEVEIWHGQQENLFQKYSHRRANALYEIRENLTKFQTVATC
jgi:hypothetical protein